MNKFIASVAFAFVAFFATLGTSSSASANEVTCMAKTPAATFKWVWVRGGKGSCNGHVLANDVAAIATKASKGQRKFRIAFQIPSYCKKGEGWASVPVVVVKNEIRAFAWNKDCTDGQYFKP